MKKFLKVVGIIFLALILVIMITAAWINFSSAVTYDTLTPQLSIIPDSASLDRGIKIIKYNCSTCHMGKDGTLSGQLFTTAESDFGEIWSGNLTRHPLQGIGKYSNEELIYLLRTGIKKDGHFAGPYMTKVNLSDEDIVSIITFLRSDDPIFKASDFKHPEPKYSFLVKALEKLGVFKPEKYPDHKIITPSSENTNEYGKYLATEVYECYSCHSASFATNNMKDPEKSPGYFGGGNIIAMPSLGTMPSPNITMHAQDGIGKYNEKQFSKLVRQGIRPNNQSMTKLMPRFSSLSEGEIHAIWEYLKTVPIIATNQEAKI